jgi:uncharacterized protein YceK
MEVLMRLVILFAVVLVVSACSSVPRSVLTGTPSCHYIGCETGGPQFYPHEENSGTELHRRWYGINGELPSDYPAGSPERKELRLQQIQKLRSMGLGPEGRPLDE